MKRIFRKSKEEEIFVRLIKEPDGVYLYKFPALFKIDLEKSLKFVKAYSDYLTLEEGKVRVRRQEILIMNVLGMPALLKKIPEWCEGPMIDIDTLYLPKELNLDQDREEQHL